jgi:hypothetical protein
MSEPQTPPAVVRAVMPMRCKAVGDRVIETTVSTPIADRMNDTVAQNWQLAEYRRNPVIFFNHHTDGLPIARSTWIAVVDGQLRSRDEFPPVGMHPFADQVHDLAVAGFINAKSAGFKALKWVYNEQDGIDYLENLLLEHSYVGLPANVEATIQGRRADVAAVRKWFGEHTVLRLGPEGFGERGVTGCPAALLCPNDTQAELCPAGAKCPQSGNARTSWRDERTVRIIDDREPVWRVDPAEFAQAWQMAVADVVTATYNRLKGRVD